MCVCVLDEGGGVGARVSSPHKREGCKMLSKRESEREIKCVRVITYMCSTSFLYKQREKDYY